MLQNAYLLAKIGADTAENERSFARFCRSRGPDAPRDRPRPLRPSAAGRAGLRWPSTCKLDFQIYVIQCIICKLS